MEMIRGISVHLNDMHAPFFEADLADISSIRKALKEHDIDIHDILRTFRSGKKRKRTLKSSG